MSLVEEVIAIQSELNLPNYILCNILNLTLRELRQFKSGNLEIDTYALIMLVSVYQKPLKSIDENME